LRFLLGQRGGESILFGARLIAVVETFALTFKASYMIINFLQVE